MTAYAVRRAAEQLGASAADQRHVEDGHGRPTCGAEAEGALVVDDPASADCVACRLIVLGPRGLN